MANVVRNHGRFLELAEEFGVFIESLHTFYLDSIVGFNILHNRLLEHQDQMKSLLGECEVTSDGFQDTCFIDYTNLCGEELNVVSLSPSMRQGEVKNRTARNGTNYVLIGRLCVVQAYTYWEIYLRKEIAVALGVLDPQMNTKEGKIEQILRQYVSIDFWGEMGLMRHAILHKGTATAKFHKMKCLTWFKPNDPIDLDFEKVQSIFATMGDFRNLLYDLSLPPHDARFPL